MPHEMASVIKWPIWYVYFKLILYSKLGGFVVTILNKRLLAILFIEKSSTRTTLNCLNMALDVCYVTDVIIKISKET